VDPGLCRWRFLTLGYLTMCLRHGRVRAPALPAVGSLLVVRLLLSVSQCDVAAQGVTVPSAAGAGVGVLRAKLERHELHAVQRVGLITVELRVRFRGLSPHGVQRYLWLPGILVRG